MQILFKNSLIIHKEKTKDILCLMSVFISDKDMAQLYLKFFYTKMTPNLNISARMSWSISEILKPFKKLTVAHYQG